MIHTIHKNPPKLNSCGFIQKITLISCCIWTLSGCESIQTSSLETADEQEIAGQNIPQIKLPILDLEIRSSEQEEPDDLAFVVLKKTQISLGLTSQATPTTDLSTIIARPRSLSANNLWPILSDRFFITPANSDNFQGYLNYYLKNPNYLTRISDRASPYLYFILQEVKSRQMPYEIALLPVVESGFQPQAKSYQSAAGLWQFMPNTGEMFGLERNWWYDGRQDVHRSTHAALNYLQQLYVQNNYDWLLALASYNAGYGNVLKAQRKYRANHPDGEANFWNIRPYLPKETQHYVPQLLAVSYLVKHRDSYNINLTPIENTRYFERVLLSKQVDFNTLTKVTGVPKDMLKLLNPGYLQPTTPPSGPFEIILPINASTTFKAALKKKPELLAVQWTKHTVKKGESLSVIADRYKTKMDAVKKLNDMKSNQIRIGKTLLIPVPMEHAAELQKNMAKTPAYQGGIYTHKVQSGESLWTIARYYDVSTKELCAWNNIGIRDPLYKGQSLKIRSNLYGKQITYILKNGDSLWTVAKKYNVSTTQLARWNQISSAKVLRPGEKISVWIKSS